MTTTCSQCQGTCESVDQYSDCCNEPVRVSVQATRNDDGCTCYKGHKNDLGNITTSIANCTVHG